MPTRHTVNRDLEADQIAEIFEPIKRSRRDGVGVTDYRELHGSVRRMREPLSKRDIEVESIFKMNS